MVKNILISLVLLIPTTLWAAQDVGMVIMSRGDVRTENSKESRPLKRKSRIFLKDTIITKKDSQAQLRINDGTIISIKPNTKYSVDEFNLDKKNPRNNKYVGKIIEGALISLSSRGEDTTHRNHTIKTPVVSIAIRGTLFELNSKTAKATQAELKNSQNAKQALLACNDVFANSGSTVVLDGALEVKDSKGKVICDISAHGPNNSCSWTTLGCFRSEVFTPTMLPIIPPVDSHQPTAQEPTTPETPPQLEDTIKVPEEIINQDAYEGT